jgi:glycosyltransferase involved in cell wall biosynthesis
VVRDGVNGLLVHPNEPAGLAAALGRLLKDRVLRGKMGAAGRQMVLERFSDRQVNAQTLTVYQRLLS